MQTFLVRIWQSDPDVPAATDRLHGVVEAVASRAPMVFRSAEELIGCIVLALDGASDVDPVARGRKPGDPLARSTE